MTKIFFFDFTSSHSTTLAHQWQQNGVNPYMQYTYAYVQGLTKCFSWVMWLLGCWNVRNNFSNEKYIGGTGARQRDREDLGQLHHSNLTNVLSTWRIMGPFHSHPNKTGVFSLFLSLSLSLSLSATTSCNHCELAPRHEHSLGHISTGFFDLSSFKPHTRACTATQYDPTPNLTHFFFFFYRRSPNNKCLV